MAKVERVLVGAASFATPLIPGEIIQRGQKVIVDQEVADNLDVHTWADKANNAQPVFVKPGDRLAERYVDEEEAPAKPVATKKKRATRRKKTA